MASSSTSGPAPLMVRVVALAKTVVRLLLVTTFVPIIVALDTSQFGSVKISTPVIRIIGFLLLGVIGFSGQLS